MISTAAPRSQGRWAAGCPAGTSRHAGQSRASTTGTLIRNTEPHQKYSSSTPPTTGPRAAPPEAMAAHTPMARARSRASVNTWRRIARVAGIISAAPIASRPRATISRVAEGA
ncbi:Uncharacterised protein [Bordetella pertussis]|nr:Uncharacterised protein [Bordetella pertussis]CFM29241.1 Uncharacterised protein [Bordetella pertussis]CFM46282.1 Uncharacterised protein [Bordetella pertussis]CFM91619.1 Uncharacterised protein [Bordetella pertussis]CFN22378.1 Uncharacterised protein [Bordetella pertussis]